MTGITYSKLNTIYLYNKPTDLKQLASKLNDANKITPFKKRQFLKLFFQLNRNRTGTGCPVTAAISLLDLSDGSQTN